MQAAHLDLPGRVVKPRGLIQGVRTQMLDQPSSQGISMKLIKTLAASAALAAALSAQAQVTGSTIGTLSGPFLTLTSTGLAPSGSFAGATLVGGTVYAADQSNADIPKGAGAATVGNFLAAGPTSGAPATLTFTAPVTNVSFLWGSPDLYNLLTVTTTAGVQTFVADPSVATAGATSLGFSVANGNQDFSQYVSFVALAGSTILSLSFDNTPKTDAFEVSNFLVATVPEPGTYALMFAGLGIAMFVVTRRRRS
jgi:hypothetical protein